MGLLRELLGRPGLLLERSWGTPGELIAALLALLECTWDRWRAPDPCWDRFWEDFKLPRLASNGCCDRLAARLANNDWLRRLTDGSTG